MEFLEKPKNPGVDDGLCALCERKIPEAEWEDINCYGCGYHICDHHNGNVPFGAHLVVDHDKDEDEDFYDDAEVHVDEDDE